MTRLIKLLPIIIPFVIYAAYLHLHFFYDYFGIDIKQWVDIDELLILFFSDLGDYGKHITIILIGTYAILRLNEYFLIKRDERMIRSRRRKIDIFKNVALVLVLAYLMYAIIFQIEKEEYEQHLNTILASVVLFPLIAIIWFKEGIEDFLALSLTKYYVLVFIFTITLLTHSLVNAAKKIKHFSTSKNYTTVYLTETECLDSLIYLGKTRNYYFLLNKKHHSSIVLDKDRIKNIKINFPEGKSFNIYN